MLAAVLRKRLLQSEVNSATDTTAEPTKVASAGSAQVVELEEGRKWAGSELNTRHRDFQSLALPTELPARDGGRLLLSAVRQRRASAYGQEWAATYQSILRLGKPGSDEAVHFRLSPWLASPSPRGAAGVRLRRLTAAAPLAIAPCAVVGQSGQES